METLPQPGADGKRITAVGVLDRSMTLLDLLADGPRPLRYLAEASGLPRPTAHRLLVALETHGLVARTPGGAFRLGPRLAEVGALLPLEAGSGGKVLLAWSEDSERFPAVPAAELAIIRRRGWAASVAERESGVASVSAPVLRNRRLLGAICVSGPASRLGQAACRRLAPAVTAAAADLAAMAG